MASPAQAPVAVSAASPIATNSEMARLECDKLRAEIQDIQKPLWQKAAFYSAVAPVALAILGLLFTWATGWFDVQRTRVSNEKTLLEAQTERLRTERTALESQAREQLTRVAHSEEEIEKLRQRESYLTNQVAKLQREREDLRLAKEALEVETKRLAGSETRASQFLEQLKSLQRTRETLLVDVQALQLSDAELRNINARQKALIGWAYEVLSEGCSIAVMDANTWVKFKEFLGHAFRVQSASTAYLPQYQVDPDPQAIPDERASRTYAGDLSAQAQRLLRQAAAKNYGDYIREAQERFDLLNTASNRNTKPNPATNSTPQTLAPSNPKSP